MYEIIPSPGTENKNWSEIEQKLHSVSPFTRTIHIDVVDGKFAQDKPFIDPAPFAKYTKDLPAGKAGYIFEVHLMVNEPIHYLKRFADAGFGRFIGQIEHMSDQVAFVAQAQLYGDVVLALDKQTPIADIHVPLIDLDGITIMTIQAGASGQQFQEALLDKVKHLRAKTDIPIEVDGGINDETITAAAVAGANRFVATSFLFALNTPEQQFHLLEEKLKAIQEGNK